MREGGFGKGTELEEKLRERHTDPGHRQAMMTGGRKGAQWPMRGDAEKSFFFTPRNVRLEGLHATGSVDTHTRLAFFVWILEGELAVQLRETLVPAGKHEKGTYMLHVGVLDALDAAKRNAQFCAQMFYFVNFVFLRKRSTKV